MHPTIAPLALGGTSLHGRPNPGSIPSSHQRPRTRLTIATRLLNRSLLSPSNNMTSLSFRASNARLPVMHNGCTRTRRAATRSPVVTICESAPAGLAMVAAGVVVPHPEKVKTGGEDAFMIANSRDKGKSRRYSLAVADGVSSWSKAGVDAGAYSSVLVTTAREVLMSGDTEYVTEGSLSQKVIGKAQDSAKVPGSSTFVVASLDESTGILDVANVGDTGVRVVRKGEVVLTSTPKQHQFECPYQLASPAFAEVNDQFDSAADAECLSFPLQDGDWLIFGSDGLYDNMYDEELVQILGGVSTTDPFSAAQAISRELAALSQDHSLDKKRETPYADALAAEVRRGQGRLD